MSEIVEWLAGVNALLGAWLVAIPFVFAGAPGMGTGFAFWNYILVGGAIFLLSGYNWWVADEDDPGSTWAAVGSALLGLWMIVVPFLTTVSAGGLLLWNDIIVGAIVAILAGYNAYEARDYDRDVAEPAA
jgi:hypothetical protein